MNIFEHRIADNISRHHLLRTDAPVIVAISGGADSVALLVALDKLGYTCVAAHCNFHLRGDESNRDMRHVADLCRLRGIDLYVKDFDVDERCRRTGESVEMACRELRYRWFDTLLDRMRAQAIAVAHHRDDNVETFFLNLMRGSSITGLTGMRWRNGHIVRPMLDIKRADIVDYLHDEGIGYVTDSTNAMNIYSRNKLRNVVLPCLADNFPGAIDGILSSITYLGENRALYDELVNKTCALYQSGAVIHLAEMLREQSQARLLLFEMIRPLGFNMSQVDDIIAAADRSGRTFSSGDTTLELSRGNLNIIARRGHQTDEVEVSLLRDITDPAHIIITDHPITDFRPVRDPGVAYFDLSVLDGNPRFAMRRWRRGDRITPFGMRGSRLLSDIFSDMKFSAEDKRNVWILTRNDEIIWVVGIRATNRYALTPESRRYLCLRVYPIININAGAVDF